MALGSNSSGDSNRIFLNVGFGKIRQKSIGREKVTAETPNAVCRKTQAGADSWGLEHDFLIGRITNIFYKEDKDYGNSFEVIIQDGADSYQLSFKDDNRNWFDFAKKLPNMNFNEVYKFSPYDFTDKDSGKRRAGFSIKQNSESVPSAYDRKDAGGKWTLLLGYPPSEGMDWKDKDEVKMYTIAVKKFFKNEFETKWKNAFAEVSAPTGLPEATQNDIPVTSSDDVPF